MASNPPDYLRIMNWDSPSKRKAKKILRWALVKAENGHSLVDTLIDALEKEFDKTHKEHMREVFEDRRG